MDAKNQYLLNVSNENRECQDELTELRITFKFLWDRLGDGTQRHLRDSFPEQYAKVAYILDKKEERESDWDKKEPV